MNIKKVKENLIEIARARFEKNPRYEIFFVNILREYFLLEYSKLKKFNSLDLDRLIDDLIFLWIFIGNDFLPYLNFMDIASGHMEKLIKLFK